MKRTILSMSLVVALATSANAANSVWFTPNGAASSTGLAAASFGLGGTSGTNLDLTCNTTLGGGTCSWPVRLMLDYQGDGGDVGIIGWALDLVADGPPGKIGNNTFVYQSTGTPGFGALNESSPSGTPNGHYYVLGGKGRARTDGASNPFGTYALMDVTLTVTKGSNDSSIQNIFGRVGAGAWGVEDPNFTQFAGQYAFGANSASPENGSADTDVGVMMRVVNTPEPSTLALLGLGALTFIRRRR